MYGSGNGSTTFNVPNLQTRVPVGSGNGYNLGDVGGEENHTLTIDEMPSHTHSIVYHDNIGNYNWGYNYTNAKSTLSDGTPSNGGIYHTGGSQPHNNMQPYTVVNYIIATGKNTGVSVQDVIAGAQALPLGVEYGGTGATNNVDAIKNLNIDKYIADKVINHKSRNLLPIIYDSQTIDGVTYTVNKDKSITINGTADEDGSTFVFTSSAEGNFTVKKNSRIICDNEREIDETTGYGVFAVFQNGEYIFGSAAINAKLAESDCNFLMLGYGGSGGITFNNITVHIMLLAPGDADETYEPYYNGLANINESSVLSMDLLWKNASPNSDFSAQTLNINTNGYSYFIIHYKLCASYDLEADAFCFNGKLGWIATPMGSGGQLGANTLCTWRAVNARSSNQISFGTSHRNSGSSLTRIEDASMCVPIEIYGVKGDVRIKPYGR